MSRRASSLALMGLMVAVGTATAQTAAPTTMAAGPTFLTDQPPDQFRASRFVGINVYGPDNQRVGDINEILIDGTGTARSAVIGVGGFLGIGEKNVAVPFASLQWSNVRPVLAATSPGGVVNSPAVPAPGATTIDPNAGMTARAVRTPEEMAAFEGRPDHAVTSLTKSDLQNAPSFKYYADTHPGAGTTIPGVLPPTATPPRP